MRLLNEDALLQCTHAGNVENKPGQSFVFITKRLVLVDNDPEGRKIGGCPNTGPGIKPCLTTLAVKEGYSVFVRITQQRVCLDSVSGLTDGTPPGVVKYNVRQPGQPFVSANA